MQNCLLAGGFGPILIDASLFIKINTFAANATDAFFIGDGGAIILTTVPFLLSNLTASTTYPIIIGSFSTLTSLVFPFTAWFTMNNLIGTFILIVLISDMIIMWLITKNLQKLATFPEENIEEV